MNFSVYNNNPVKLLSYQLSSAVNSCQQLMTVDENENQLRELWHRYKLQYVPKNPVEFCSYHLSTAEVKPVLDELGQNTQLI